MICARRQASIVNLVLYFRDRAARRPREMKYAIKINIISMIFLLLSGVASAKEAKWTQSGKSDGSNIYFDFDDVDVRDGVVNYWTLFDYSSKRDGGVYSSVMSTRLDCKANTVKILNGKFYSEHMAKGEILFASVNKDAETMPIEAGTGPAAMRDLFCRKSSASVPSVPQKTYDNIGSYCDMMAESSSVILVARNEAIPKEKAEALIEPMTDPASIRMAHEVLDFAYAQPSGQSVDDMRKKLKKLCVSGKIFKP